MLSANFVCGDEKISLTEDTHKIVLNQNRQHCTMQIEASGGGGDADETQCRYAQVGGSNGVELPEEFGECWGEIRASNSTGKGIRTGEGGS